MPNYVQNKITFECPYEKAKEILTAVMYDPDPSNKDSTGYFIQSAGLCLIA